MRWVKRKLNPGFSWVFKLQCGHLHALLMSKLFSAENGPDQVKLSFFVLICKPSLIRVAGGGVSVN